MGNAMGYSIENGFNLYTDPEITPDPTKEPTFDPNLGFQNRKKRVAIATQDQLESAKIPLKHRDYCAHLLLGFRKCRVENFPWVVRCEHEKHAYLNCQYDDFVLRMKEFEREKRLRLREKKLAAAEM